MGGFGALIGGTGQAALNYGQQIRGLLEQRRESLANLMINSGMQEVDPQIRSEYLGHASDLLGGKDFAKVLPGIAKTVQGHMQSTHALAQIGGGPPAPPPQTPVAAVPPATPGTATAPAAQPGQSPIQPEAQTGAEIDVGQGLIPLPAGAAAAPQPQPLAAAPSTSPLAMMNLPSLGGVSPEEALATPAGRTFYGPLIQHQATINLELGYKRNVLQNLKASPEWKQIVEQYPFMGPQMEMWAGTPGQQLPSFAPFINLMGVHQRPLDVTGMTPEERAQKGVPPGLNGTQQFNFDRLGNNLGWVGAAPARYVTVTGPDAKQYKVDLQTNMVEPLMTGAGQAVPGSQVAGIKGASPTGEETVTNLADIAAGKAPKPTGQVVPSMQPRTRVTSTLGAPPTVTQTTVGGAAAAPPAPGVPGPPATSANDALAKQMYESWAAGGPAPPPRSMPLVQDYMRKYQLDTPVVLSATGQANLQGVDDVLGQIAMIKKLMEDRGLNKDNTLGYQKDYLTYRRLGHSAQNQDLFTALKFESLRSAAAALKSTNSRAYPIIREAFVHTPDPDGELPDPIRRTLGKAPDTPRTMYGKLNEMQTILTNSRKKILQDERRSGVVPIGEPTVPYVEGGNTYDIPVSQEGRFTQLHPNARRQ